MPLIAAVTDQVRFAEPIEHMLEAAGFAIVTISPVALLPWLSDHEPGLILLDCSREYPQGLDFLRRVRVISDVPTVVFIRGYEPISVARILTAGADDVIEFGTEGALVWARMRAVLRRYANASSAWQRGDHHGGDVSGV